MISVRQQKDPEHQLDDEHADDQRCTYIPHINQRFVQSIAIGLMMAVRQWSAWNGGAAVSACDGLMWGINRATPGDPHTLSVPRQWSGESKPPNGTGPPYANAKKQSALQARIGTARSFEKSRAIPATTAIGECRSKQGKFA
jgi:hypothetical protein